MNSKNTSTFAIALLLVAQGSLAQDFCAKPYDAVCTTEHRVEYTARQARIDELGDLLRDRALRAVAKSFGIKSGSISESDLYSISPKSARQKYVAKYYQHIRRLLRVYLKRAGMKADLDFESTRRQMAHVLMESKTLSPVMRDKMSAVLKGVRILTLDEVLFTGRNALTTAEALKECGPDGMQDNAFADEVGGKNVVIVCPGSIVAALEFAREHELPPKWLSAGLMVTLAHEMGHHVDWRDYPEAYRSAEMCLDSRFPLELTSPIESYMHEISADIWGAEVFGKVLMSAPQELRATLVEGALEDLCATEDDGEHPSGHYRLNRLMGGSPMLLRAMGCAEPLACVSL